MIKTILIVGILTTSLSGEDAIVRNRVPLQDSDQTAVSLLPAPSQDPWIIRRGDRYYYSESKENGIAIRETKDFTDLARTKQRVVWKAPATGPCSRNVWAPELHFLQGRWYLYFAADDGRNENHRMWVVRSETDSPFGPYGEPTRLETDGWAIDGTVFQSGTGLFFFWSGWPGTTDGRQNVYAARMADPMTISSPRLLLAEPTQAWEQHVMPLCEGPQLLGKEGILFLVYSASASWTRHYCLGMLVNTGGDILDPAAWRKVGPVFQPTDSVWGVGHCSFVRSGDGKEDWILYHAKTNAADGWADRSVRAQRFGWGKDRFPDFGKPLPIRLINNQSVR